MVIDVIGKRELFLEVLLADFSQILLTNKESWFRIFFTTNLVLTLVVFISVVLEKFSEVSSTKTCHKFATQMWNEENMQIFKFYSLCYSAENLIIVFFGFTFFILSAFMLMLCVCKLSSLLQLSSQTYVPLCLPTYSRGKASRALKRKTFHISSRKIKSKECLTNVVWYKNLLNYVSFHVCLKMKLKV